jgi:hypothetical protein
VAFPEAIDGLGKLLKKSTVNADDVIHRVFTGGYSDEAIEATFKGINKGVIDDLYKVDAEGLTKLDDLTRKAGWSEGVVDTSGAHKVERMIDKPGRETHVFDTNQDYFGKVDNVEVLKKGSISEGWGWDHIDYAGHNSDIKYYYGLADKDKSVKDIITRTVREGKWDAPNMRYHKSYWSPKENKYIELQVFMSDENPGSITNAFPDI